MKRYEELEHTADLRIAFYGRTIGELFENAGLGLFELMVDPLGESPVDRREIQVDGDDLEELIVNWLRLLHGLYVVDDEVVTALDGCRVDDDGRVVGYAGVVPFDSTIHQRLREIKAVTYHDVRVEKEGDRWSARIVFDV